MVEILEINHINIVVKSIEAARQFYCGILGFEDTDRNPSFMSRGAWLRAGRAEIHLLQQDYATHPPGDLSFAVHRTTEQELSSSRHFSLVITDTDKLVETLNQFSVPIVYGPIERQGGLVQTYCYDPDGHLIEFSQFRT